MESTRQDWYGDMDLGDGELQKQYEAYMARLKLVDGISREIGDRHQRLQTCSDLRKQYEAYMARLKLVDGISREIGDRHQRLQTCSDLRVIVAQLQEIHLSCYSAHLISLNLVALKDHIVENKAKLAGGKATDKTLYALGWTIDELSRLTDECRGLLVELESLLEKLEDESTDVVRINIPRTLSKCQERLRIFTKSVTRHKRMPASHILVTMISPSERNQKPYALPISCIPYLGERHAWLSMKL